MYYVYVYYHPLTNEAVYVGKGTKDRYKSHLYGDNNVHHHNKPFRDWILQLRSEGLVPTIEQKCFVDKEADAYLEERRLIKYHGRRDNNTGTLFNKTNGGEGYSNSGNGWSDEQRAKHKQRTKDNPKGQAVDQYTINGDFVKTFWNTQELRNGGFSKYDCVGIRHCCNYQRFSAVGYRWTKHGQDLGANTKGTPVCQLHPDTHELLGVFISAAQASADSNTNPSDILQCIKGNMLTAGGYVWCSPKYNPTNTGKRVRRIEQRTESGEVVAVFRSASSAARAIGIDVANILGCLKGKRKTAGGYIWEYVNT